jgi:hypothetical protein
MKTPIVLSVTVAFILLAGSAFAPSFAQPPTTDDTPTFYRLIPGTYVNGWPRFTVRYPKDWVEEKPAATEVFRVASPDPAFEGRFTVTVAQNPLPLDKTADLLVGFLKNIAKDVAVVADNPTRLRDGTPAREVELKMVMNGVPTSFSSLSAKKGDILVRASLGSQTGKIGDDLKAFVNSLQFESGKDEPVTAPPDIEGFLDQWCRTVVSHDVAKVVGHYSDRYIASGVKKGELERFFGQWIRLVTSFELRITDFVAVDGRVYLAGFLIGNLGKTAFANSIIKENGEWKFYGNQRDPAP